MSGTAHSELDRLTLIINQENVLQVYPQARLVGGLLFFPLFFWFFETSLNWGFLFSHDSGLSHVDKGVNSES